MITSDPRRLAAVADGLTGLRAALAIPLFWATAAEAYGAAAALLTLAWWSDYLDGRVARSTSAPTRLGPWDPVFDALIGTALLGGLISSETVSMLPWGITGAALLAGFLVWRNLSLGMLVQALAYAFFLAEVWTHDPWWMLVLTATIGAILILDWHRFFKDVLPSFFAGISGTSETDRPAEAE